MSETCIHTADQIRDQKQLRHLLQQNLKRLELLQKQIPDKIKRYPAQKAELEARLESIRIRLASIPVKIAEVSDEIERLKKVEKYIKRERAQ